MRIRQRLFDTLSHYDRRFWTLFGVQLIVAVGFGAAMPFVSIYLHAQLGVSMTYVGMIMLVSALVAAGGRIIGGEIADRLGRRPLLIFGMAARVLIFALMAYAIHVRASALIVGGIFVAVRLVGATVRPGLSAMVADVVESERRVEAYALFRIGSNAGWAIGPAIGGFLVATSYASLFLLTAFASLIGLLLLILFTSESIRVPETGQFSLRRVLDVAHDLRFLVFCGWSVVLFVVMGQFASTLAVFSTQVVGIAEAQLGILFTINGIAVVLFQWPAARLSNRIGVRWGLVLGCLLYALGYFSVSFASAFPFLIGSMIVITLGEVTFSPTSMAAVANMAPEQRVGRYMGLFGLTEALGWSLGPFVGGILFDVLYTTPVALWGIIAAIGVTAAVGFGTTTRGRRIARRKEAGNAL
jgi:MFS family permease